MIMKIKNSVLNLFLISLSALFLLSSCSLKYQKENSSEKNIPQLTFTNLHLTQYSDNKKTLELSGSTVEQYKDSSLAFIKDADFSMFDSDNKKTSSGKATLISADSREEIFKFFEDTDSLIILFKNGPCFINKEDLFKFYEAYENNFSDEILLQALILDKLTEAK